MIIGCFLLYINYLLLNTKIHSFICLEFVDNEIAIFMKLSVIFDFRYQKNM